MACLFLRETTIALTVKYKLLQKLDSVQVFFKENDNNNRNNFKQMNKKIIIITEDLIVGGTLNLSSLTHSLLDFDIEMVYFDTKMMFELIK